MKTILYIDGFNFYYGARRLPSEGLHTSTSQRHAWILSTPQGLVSVGFSFLQNWLLTSRGYMVITLLTLLAGGNCMDITCA
jgi:hypothetical protein